MGQAIPRVPRHYVWLPEDNKNDQSRVVTPHDALVKNKVSGIVIGRSLILGNIKKNIRRLIDNLNQ